MSNYRIRARSHLVWVQSPLAAAKVRNRLAAVSGRLRLVDELTVRAWEGCSLTRRTPTWEYQPFYDRLGRLNQLITEDEGDAAQSDI